MKALVLSISLLLSSSVGGVFYWNSSQYEEALEQVKAEYQQQTAQANQEIEALKDSVEMERLELAELKSRIIIHPLKEVDKAYTTRPFGLQVHPVYKVRRNHEGLDFGSTNKLNPIRSSTDGKVISVKYYKKSGWTVAIHNEEHNIIIKYMHLRYNPSTTTGKTKAIKRGDFINAAEVFGIIGSTGTSSTATHLHYEIHEFNEETLKYEPVDPNSGKYVFIDDINPQNPIAEK